MTFSIYVAADAVTDSASASRSLTSCSPTIAANWSSVRKEVLFVDRGRWTRLLYEWYEVGCEAEVEQEFSNEL